MPIYLGHPNNKGLNVSPGLKALGIDLLRASPCDVRIVANPKTIQDGYSSYITHLSAFMLSFVTRESVPTNRTGYPVQLDINFAIPLQLPQLVVSYNGQIPTTAMEVLNSIGYERAKMNKKDDLLVFSDYTLEEARAIAKTNPYKLSPAPGGSVNLHAFESYIVVWKVISNFLLAHTYPAFNDENHEIDLGEGFEESPKGKRVASSDLTEAPPSKTTKTSEGASPAGVNNDDMDTSLPLPKPAKQIHLRRAKPPNANLAWGNPSEIPNASGLFFPYVPDLASYDTKTVPLLIEDYFLKSLSISPEAQVDRADQIRSAWGIIGKTDTGNVLAHICMVIRLAIRSQCRAFPIIADDIYQGCILSGAKFYLGISGKIVYPSNFAKLQEETGQYKFHTRVLQSILGIVEEKNPDLEVSRPDTMRQLRTILLGVDLSEEDRDEIRKLSVHLNFKEKFLGLNAQTIIKLLGELRDLGEPDDTLPLHHNALMSRDAIFVALSAFGYQAPSPLIDSCPKIKITGDKPPLTFVFRQKPIDIATLDWKKVLETKEITNNPKNLSRQNRDRSIVGNDKVTVWGKMIETMSSGGTLTTEKVNVEVVVGNEDDGVGAW